MRTKALKGIDFLSPAYYDIYDTHKPEHACIIVTLKVFERKSMMNGNKMYEKAHTFS